MLSDRYRLTSLIAVGGMGEVWAADDALLGRRVAVKILRPELTSDPEFVDRFRAEARITASLNSPGIAAVFDYGEVSSTPAGPRDTAFLVMELVVGEPLSAVLARSPRLSLLRTLDVLEQSGRALQVAHDRALVHRDIKPGNILITPAGQVKITDFGIAKAASEVPVTRGGMVMGTAQYLSPEQAAGQHAFPGSDVYSLGVVAFECLAGRRPFDGPTPLAVASAHVNNPPPPLPPDVAGPVAALVMSMLAKDPAMRLRDGRSVAFAVAQLRIMLQTADSREGAPGATGPSVRYGATRQPSGPPAHVPAGHSAPGYAAPRYPAPRNAQNTAGQYAAGQYSAAPYPAALDPAARNAGAQHPAVRSAARYPVTAFPSSAGAAKAAETQRDASRRRSGILVSVAVLLLVAAVVVGYLVLVSVRGTALPGSVPSASGYHLALDGPRVGGPPRSVRG